MIRRGTPVFAGLRRLALIVRSKWTGQVTSILLHGMLIVFGGLLFYEPTEYGIQVSSGMEKLLPTDLSAEVEIEEEPAPELPAVPAVAQSEMLPESHMGSEAEPEASFFEEPKPVPAEQPPSAAIPGVAAALLPVQPVLFGKVFVTNKAVNATSKPGSSASAKGTAGNGSGGGNKRASVDRGEGSQLSSKPAYLLSPQPAYPAEARKQKQEGRVKLLVNVDETGGVASLRLKESSGYPVLDESALNAVRGWRFYPAKIRGISVESSVEVPVRFRLD